MKTMLKIGVFAAVTGAIIWSIPPARRQIEGAYRQFSTAFHEAEDQIRDQLLADRPLSQTAPLPDDDEWF